MGESPRGLVVTGGVVVGALADPVLEGHGPIFATVIVG
jgi:hypothetical protein